MLYIKIRNINDTDDIDYIYNNLYLKSIEFHSSLNKEFGRFFEDNINYLDIETMLKNKYSYIALFNNKPIGILIAENPKDSITIDTLYIEEKYRNKNIGTNLMNKLLKDHGHKDIKTLILEENEDKTKFYNKFGFKSIDILNAKKYKITSFLMKRVGVKKDYLYRAILYKPHCCCNEHRRTIVCSSKEKLLEKIKKIIKETGNENYKYHISELDITDPIDILI